MVKPFIAAIASFSLVGCQAASPAPRIDRNKLEPLYRAAKTIESSIGVGVNYATLSELLQKLNTELSIARDKPLKLEERAVVDAYAEAVPIYRDSLTFWQLKIEKGRFLSSYGQAEELAEKYSIQHESTTTIDSDKAVQILWAKAGEQLAKGNAIYAKEP